MIEAQENSVAVVDYGSGFCGPGSYSRRAHSLGEDGVGDGSHPACNSRPRPTHSLFRQGCMLYDLIPTMPDSRLRPLMAHFTELMQQKPVLSMTFSIT